MEGVNVQRSLHPQYHDWGALEQGTEPPTASRVLQHWLPTALCVCVCVFVCVCVCVFTSHCYVCTFGWVKCRAQIPSMGHHIWPNVISFPIFLYVNAQSGGVWDRGRNGIGPWFHPRMNHSCLRPILPYVLMNDWSCFVFTTLGNFTLAELGICEPAPHQNVYCPDIGLLQHGYTLSAGSDADSDPEVPISPEQVIQLWAGHDIKSRRSSGLSSRENSALTLTDSENENKSDDESGERKKKSMRELAEQRASVVFTRNRGCEIHF